MKLEYISILLLIIISILITCVIVVASYILAPQIYDAEKNSAYECGFSPFEDARSQFDIKFYLVSILFIIFDLEVSYLFPWASRIDHIEGLGYWSMILFLFILTIGFVYEWMKGALDWN